MKEEGGVRLAAFGRIVCRVNCPASRAGFILHPSAFSIPIVLAALLVAAACDQSAAQSNAEGGRIKAGSETRPSAVLPSGITHPSSFILQPSRLESSDGTSASHRK